MKMHDLGYTYDEPMAISEKKSNEDNKPKTHYPSIYLSDLKEMISLPDEGEAVIKFKVVARGENERNGEKRHSLELEIHSIGAKDQKKHEKSTGERDSENLDVIEQGLKDAESTKED